MGVGTYEAYIKKIKKIPWHTVKFYPPCTISTIEISQPLIRTTIQRACKERKPDIWI